MTVVDVHSGGGVQLGPDVVCDGFVASAMVRVQTHIHTDHLHDFDSSKGFQDVVASEATHELLCTLDNADLPYRSNFRGVPYGTPLSYGSTTVTLLPNDHMMGSVQVQADLPNGSSVGYSGDFFWPTEQVIQVDTLVVDATYGSPESIREYTQAECEEHLVSLVTLLLDTRPVHLLAHRGTLQRALQVLTGRIEVPVVGSTATLREAAIYRERGYVIGELLDDGEADGAAALASGRYIRLFGTGDKLPVEPESAATVKCSAYMARRDTPVLEYSERSYGVALSNHADFNGTLEYVAATGAKRVITDNTRGGRGVTLAMEIRNRLGIDARASSNLYSREWGAGA